MAQGSYPITGIPLPAGADIPARQEITVWYSNPENELQVSLFMQAMANFKKLAIGDRLSFFQIAGIHSYPLVGWDGDNPAPLPPDPNDLPGYCHHNKVTFPIWHRPYMLLYEQAIFEQMKVLIADWKRQGTLSAEELPRWEKAACQWRLPYWDWARVQPYVQDFGLPQICTLANVPIHMPGAADKVPFPNPLTGFTNPKKIDGKNIPMGDERMGDNRIKPNGAFPWDKCIGVSRYGILKDLDPSKWVDGVNNWANANSSISRPPWYWKKGGPFSDAVSRMLSPNYFDSYETFSSTQHNNKKTDPQVKGFLSIEYIHNIVHNAVGGQFLSIDQDEFTDPTKKPPPNQPIGLGHMSDVPVAAFDPAFWFHHCNIDRLCAMWQTLNWDKWFDKPREGDNKPTDPLIPFHYDTERSDWTGNMARDWKESNYTYDDLVYKPEHKNSDGTINQEKYLKDLRTHINTLYPGADQQANDKQVLDLNPASDGSGTFDDYVINVVYDRYALGGKAYSILFFVGEPPKGQELPNYRQHGGYLGEVFTFSAPIEVDGAVACGNCKGQKDAKVLSKAQIPITVPLLTTATYVGKTLDAGQSVGFIEPVGSGFLDPGDPAFQQPTPANIEDLLRVGLRTLFVELGGTVRDAADFPDTQVKVMHGKGVYVDDESVLPRYKVGYKALTQAGDTSPNLMSLRDSATGPDLILDDPYEE